LKPEKGGVAVRDEVGALVEGSEQGSGGVAANENVSAGEEVGWNGGGRGRGLRCVVSGGGWDEKMMGLKKVWGKRGIDRGVKGGGGLGGKGEVVAIGGLGRGDVKGLSGSSPKAEEDPGKMVVPVGGGSTGGEGGLETAVKALDETVGLGMIGGGGVVCDVEKGAKVGPEGGGELRTTVRGDVARHTVARDPVVNEVGGSGSGGEGNGVDPAGGAVHDGEKMGVSLGGRERTNQVDVKV